MRWATIIAMLMLAGCDQLEKSNYGRYQIVPAPGGVKVAPNVFNPDAPAVWRLDTETGALTYCVVDPTITCQKEVRP